MIPSLRVSETINKRNEMRMKGEVSFLKNNKREFRKKAKRRRVDELKP